MKLPLTGLLGQLTPILHLLGLDQKANALGRDQVRPRFEAAIPATMARLEADGHTAAREGDGPAAERFRIRAAMYLLAKDAFSHLLPQGANLAADFLRDRHDDQIVAQVAPQVDASTTTQQLVELVVREWVELLF